MTEYDRLRARALDALATHLATEGVETGDGIRVIDALREASLPGFLGMLGNSKTPQGQLGQAFLHEAAGRLAATPSVKKSGLKADDIERVLTATFIHGASPDALLADSDVRNAVLEAAVEQSAKQTGAPLTPAQAEEAIQLLTTGAFFGDAASAIGTVAFAVRDLPIAAWWPTSNTRRTA